MGRRSPRIHAVQTAGNGDRVALGDAARYGRVAAMQRRRAMSQGKQALNAGRAASSSGAGAPSFIVLRGGAG